MKKIFTVLFLIFTQLFIYAGESWEFYVYDKDWNDQLRHANYPMIYLSKGSSYKIIHNHFYSGGEGWRVLIKNVTRGVDTISVWDKFYFSEPQRSITECFDDYSLSESDRELLNNAGSGMLIPDIDGYYSIGFAEGDPYKIVIKYPELSGSCGKNLTWSFDTITNTLSIVGYGEMTSHPWEFISPALIEEVSLPEGLTSICSSAFENCHAISSVTIPEGVTSIGDSAFVGCSFTSIILPSSLTNIGSMAFERCNLLNTIQVLSKTPPTIGTNVFSDIDKKLIHIPDNSRAAYQTTWGAEYRFLNNETTLSLHVATPGTLFDLIFEAGMRPVHIVKLILSGTLNEADIACMRETMTYLAEIDLLNITNTSGVNFYGKSNLLKLILPKELISIDENALRDCSSLNHVEIPNCVTKIEGGAFNGCSSLLSINLPNNIVIIGAGAFEGCSLISSIELPNSVTTIGSFAFSNCSNLTSISGGNNLIHIGENAFANCDALRSITIPNSVISIGNNAFLNCSNLPSIKLPNNLKEIEYNLFRGCSNLAFITIPNNVTTIGNYAFAGCSKLTSITIPSKVTSIGYYAFNDCNNLSSVVCLGDTPPAANDLSIDRETCTLLVPSTGYAQYIRHAYWGQFLNIETSKLTVLSNNDDWGQATWTGSYLDNEPVILTATPNEGYKFVQWHDGNTDNPRTITVTDEVTYTATFAPSNDNQCGENLFWKYNRESRTLTITGTGDMFDYGEVDVPWKEYINSIQYISLPDGITSIGRVAFMGCAALLDINFPNTLTDIGEGAFMDCSMLIAADLNAGLINLGDAVFMNCESLTKVIVPEGVSSIGYSTFYGCSNLNELSIPNTIDSIWVENAIYEIENVEDFQYGCYVIWKCTKLEKLCAPTFVFNIPDEDVWHEAIDGVFPKNTLTSLVLHSGRVSKFVFDVININHETLQTIDLSSTTSDALPEKAFYGYRKLENLSLSSGIATIPYMVAAECLHLKSVNIPATVEVIDERAFENCRLLSEVNFAEGGALTEIGNWAFYNCHELKNVVIPEGVTNVGYAAFYGCTYLKEITLPSTLVAVADNGFALCEKLEKINVKAAIPPVVDARTFENVDRMIPVVVPTESVAAYRSAPVWQEFNIQGKDPVMSDVENIGSDNGYGVMDNGKILRNGQLIIIRDGVEYNTLGQAL